MPTSSIPADPTLAEDLLLLLFSPESGDIAGEDTLFYTLGGATLADLVLSRTVIIRSGNVTSTGRDGPRDPLLREVWDRVARKPVDAQELIADIGPDLRTRVLERIVNRGDIRQERRRILGPLSRTVLVDGGTRRRTDLIEPVCALLTGESGQDARTITLAALVWASGNLPALAPDVPSTAAVHDRGRMLAEDDVAAAALAVLITQRNRSIETGAYRNILDSLN